MPYIGKEPVAGNFVLLDSITTSATATYALTKDSVAYSPESARNMIVSLNGVTQAPETAFTVSGSNITFSSALTSSDVIDYILVLGDVLSVGTPSDGTVGTSQMSYPLDNFSSTGIDDNATSTAITIDSSQKVGIGTTSPARLLTLSGSGATLLSLVSTDDDNCQLLFGDSASDTVGKVVYAHDTNHMRFETNAAERMRISSAGDVQIGTAAVTGGRYFDIYNTGSTATDFAITRFITQQVGSSSTTSADIIKRKNGEFGIINNDTDSAAHINFKVGASERMRIDSSGDVGIGVTDPQRKLHVHTGSGSSYVSITNGTTGSTATDGVVIGSASDSVAYFWNYENADMGFATNNTERMRINSSGSVGIGLSPAFTAGGSRKLLQIANSTNGAQIAMSNSSNESENPRIFSDSTSLGFATAATGSGAFQFYTAGTERMRIDSSGRVGVGVTSPVNSVDINTGATSRVKTSDGTRELFAGVWASQPRIQGVAGTLDISANGAYDIAFSTNSTERMRIDASGNVIVGASSAAAASATTLAPDGGIKAILASGTGGEYLIGAISGVSNGHQISVDTSNNQTYKWHNGGTANMTLTSSGQLVLPGVAGDTTSDAANLNIRTSDGLVRRSTSSRKYKNNITDATHGLTELLALRSVTYKGNNDGDRIFGGLIAEEVHEAGLTEFVQYDSEGNPDALAYGHMIALCVKAIQELTARVAELEGA